MKQHTYIAIDLKSFYASVECRDRGLDPLDTNLVVADESRTDKTICLAVTPTLKSFGISGRARLFEVKQKAKSEGQRVFWFFSFLFGIIKRTFTGVGFYHCTSAYGLLHGIQHPDL